jgi:hypothetical protein
VRGGKRDAEVERQVRLHVVVRLVAAGGWEGVVVQMRERATFKSRPDPILKVSSYDNRRTTSGRISAILSKSRST